MTTGCFQVSFSFCATMRAKKSVAPPGGCPERKRTGFDGYDCANVRLPCARSRQIESVAAITPCVRHARFNRALPSGNDVIAKRTLPKGRRLPRAEPILRGRSEVPLAL